jgi:hypothetical protein
MKLTIEVQDDMTVDELLQNPFRITVLLHTHIVDGNPIDSPKTLQTLRYVKLED